MKFLIFLLITILPFSLFAKGRDNYSSTIIKVSPSDKESLLREVRWTLNLGVIGQRAIEDKRCKNFKLEGEGNFFEAKVNGKSFYILDSERTINLKRYKKSTCYKSKNGDITQVECIARTLDAIQEMNEDDKLVFYTKYSSKAILTCPSSGSIEY